MKFFATYLFVFALLYQTVGQLAVIAYFRANQAVIASTKCENREKPKLKCAGKCYLTKQLKNLEDKQDSKKASKEGKTELLSYVSSKLTALAPFVKEKTSTVFNYLTNSSIAHLSDVFHPPSF
ncbi:MAG: hypothetical protein H7Y13_01855 [Sphingobacteriaceae bacterium]|nr:hypothetical protein [Sphingobacteriaceae bacterium]